MSRQKNWTDRGGKERKTGRKIIKQKEKHKTEKKIEIMKQKTQKIRDRKRQRLSLENYFQDFCGSEYKFAPHATRHSWRSCQLAST
jgi:hypothetical protein